MGPAWAKKERLTGTDCRHHYVMTPPNTFQEMDHLARNDFHKRFMKGVREMWEIKSQTFCIDVTQLHKKHSL